MVAFSRLITGLLLPAAASGISLTRGASERKNNIDAIQAIQKRLGEEGTADKKANDDLSCWCQTNVKDKQETVDQMNSDLSQLGHDMEQQTAANSQTESELNTHASDLESNEQALAKAQAIREKEASKFEDDETSHQQAVNSLDDALTVVEKSHGHEMHENAAVQMEAMFKRSGSVLLQKRAKQVLLQVSAKQSPDVVYGTLKQMKSTFSKELEEMRHSEKAQVEGHNELISAKTDEINTLKKQLIVKKQRLAEGRVEVTQKEEQSTKSKALMEVNVAVLQDMKDFCDANDASFTAREEDRQEENQALADALVDLTGAEFLSTGARRQGQAPEGNPVDDLCMAAIGITEKEWRQKAKAACEQAKGGDTQGAADVIESLEDDMKVAQSKNEADKKQCAQDMSDAQATAAEAAHATEAQEGAVKSDMQTDEANINAVAAQADSAQKAKEQLAAACMAQHEILQQIRQASVHEVGILDKVKNSSPTAAMPKIEKAIQHSDKLSEAAAAYDTSRGEKMQTVSEALDSVTRAAKKLEIPLKLMHADAEEAELNVRQDKKSNERLTRVECDMPSLVANEQKLAGYIKNLGSASEGMMWKFLR